MITTIERSERVSVMRSPCGAFRCLPNRQFGGTTFPDGNNQDVNVRLISMGGDEQLTLRALVFLIEQITVES